MQPSNYEYTALPSAGHIRLITLHAGSTPSILSCSVLQTPLTNAPHYTCLSYAWGEPEFSHKMLLDGQPFLITPNMASALQALRSPITEQVMWIDAICINQADVQERNSQVSIMCDIYRNSSKVLVWIGEARDESDRAMAFLREMGENNSGQSEIYSYPGSTFIGRKQREVLDRRAQEERISVACDAAEKDDPDPEDDSDLKDDGFDALWKENAQRWGHIMFGFPVLHEEFGRDVNYMRDRYLDDWRAVDALLARPWWSRAWVVQEVWQSSNVELRCGDCILDWCLFERAMHYHEAWDEMGSLVEGTPREREWDLLKRRYSLAIHISKGRLLGSKLSDILWNTWDRDAADPRDKVFAILSLVHQDHQHGDFIRPDYSKTMNEVFRETAKSIITREQSLDILLAANGLSRRGSLPSWVPDWRKEANDEKPILLVNRERLNVMYFSGSMSAVIVHGHGYAASGHATPACTFDEDLSTIKVSAILVDTVAKVGQIHQKDTSAEDMLQHAVLTAKAADRIDSTKSSSPTLEDDVRTVLFGGILSRRTMAADILKGILEKRRFFVTTKGYMSIGPAILDTDDTICIIAGCNFPLVLRWQKEHYGLVGEAYVHGIMQGEAVNSSWQQIQIR